MTLRIFMTTDAIGGVWRYASVLAERLGTAGASVRLGVIGGPPSLSQVAALERMPGVDHVCVSAPLDWLAGDGRALAAGAAEIAAAADAWGADMIHLNQPAYGCGTHSQPVLSVAHSCVETWWRATRAVSAPSDWKWHREAVGHGLRHSAEAVAPTAAFAATLASVYGLDRMPSVVHNGLPAAGSAGRKSQYLLAAGRTWDESKNFGLLDAAATGIEWPVHLAGACVSPGGSAATEFPNLVCLGELGREAISAQFAAAPIFVSPSLYEPFGLAVLEAAQAEAALLLADIQTFRELWSGAALFFDPRDPRSLSDRANELIREPDLIARWGRAARSRAAEYGADRHAAAMLDLYRTVARCRMEPQEVQ